MGSVAVVPLASVEPVELPQGSWSRMLVTEGRVGGNRASLGYSVFTPGTVTAAVKHETEEVAYVVAGSGEIRLDEGAAAFRTGDALHVPAGVWHAVANTGEEDVVMVFGFPHPDYPPTERRGSGLAIRQRLSTGVRLQDLTPTTTAQTLREQVAWACRILAAEGYADLTLGHVSAREPGGATVYIKRKGIALDEVAPEDIVEADDASADLHLETVLHTEMYRARPDVGAVVHGHPPYATALSATTAELELLTHDAVLFADGIARFEDPDLIVEPEQGAAVARALGTRRAVLLRNHGVIVVGRDVPWAVLAAVTLERAARLQAIASALGELRPISPELAAALLPVKYRDDFVDEYWNAWVRGFARAGGQPGGDHG